MTDSPEVDELLAAHTDAVAATTRRLRRVILDGHPQLVERVRSGWHSINYADPVGGYVCGLFPRADRVQLVFEHGASLPDPLGLLSGTGRRVRTLEFPEEGAVDAAVVLAYLDVAVDAGAAPPGVRRG